MVSTRAAHRRSGSPTLVQGLEDSPGSRRSSPAKSEQSGTSEGSKQEKPVREQLEKTTIDTPQEETAATETLDGASAVEPVLDGPAPSTPSSSGRSGSSRKRSFDEVEHTNEIATKPSKKSRDSDDEKDWVHVEPAAEDGTWDAKDDVGPNATVQIEAPTADDTAQPANPAPTIGAATVNGVPAPSTGPQRKRSRDTFLYEAKLTEAGKPEALNEDTLSDEKNTTSTSEPQDSPAVTEPDPKRVREGTPLASAKESSKPGSGFANTSAESPFNGLKSSKSPFKQSQPGSGFANTSTESPFNALKAPESPFQAPAPSTKPFPACSFTSLAASAQPPFSGLSPQKLESESKPSESGSFGSTVGATTGFGSPSSAFGGQSGFGSLGTASGGSVFGGKLKLKSFAGDSSSADFLGKPSRAFGAPADKEDKGAKSVEDAVPDAADAKIDATDRDENFYVFNKDAGTGEEGENTIFSQRAKLYINVDKQWKERGVGVFKVNVPKPKKSGDVVDSEPTMSGRFVMRADGSHKIVLNSLIKKEMTIRDPSGGRPKGKTALFLGYVDELPTLCQLKMRTPEMVEELHDAVISLQEGM